MSEIIPEGFSWSASRHELFERCPRAYFFHYYLALGRVRGVDRQRVAEAKRLRSMTNIWMWIGSCVHDTIEGLLREAHAKGRRPSVEEASERMLAQMREDYRSSKRAPEDPRAFTASKVRFHEHEYAQDPGRDVWQRAAADAKQMVVDFDRLDYLDVVAGLSGERMLGIEELSKWFFEGCPVWVKIDLAYRDEDGRIHVVDWKTGKSVREDDPVQLLGYATYANDRWNHGDDGLSVREVYLRHGQEKPCELDDGKLAGARDKILESIRGMLSTLEDPNQNVAIEDDFPTAPDTKKCSRCFFRGICPEMQESA